MVMTVPTQQHEPRPRGSGSRMHSRPPSCATWPKLAATAMVAADRVQLLQNTWLVDKQPHSLPSLYPSI